MSCQELVRENSLFVVGNGANISLLEDPCIPSFFPVLVLVTRQCNLSTEVKELFHLGTRVRDRGKCDKLFE